MFTVALVTWLPWLPGCYGSGRHGDRTVWFMFTCSQCHIHVYQICLVVWLKRFLVILIYTYLLFQLF